MFTDILMDPESLVSSKTRAIGPWQLSLTSKASLLPEKS